MPPVEKIRNRQQLQVTDVIGTLLTLNNAPIKQQSWDSRLKPGASENIEIKQAKYLLLEKPHHSTPKALNVGRDVLMTTAVDNLCSLQNSFTARAAVQSKKREENWNANFENLRSYKNRCGNCLMPASYQEDPELGAWVYRQRKKKDTISSERRQILDSIGFEWTQRRQTKGWDNAFLRLVEYYENHGSCLVPQVYQNDLHLGRWVTTQRNNRLALSRERRDRLDSIEFVWVVTVRDSWETMFTRLSLYVETHGNCLVPARYKQDPKLGMWVRAQRKNKEIMSSERTTRLDLISFVWKLRQMH